MTKHDVQVQLRAITEKGYNFKDALSRAQQGFASMTEMPSGDIILYQRDTGESVIEVRLEGETVWVT